MHLREAALSHNFPRLTSFAWSGFVTLSRFYCLKLPAGMNSRQGGTPPGSRQLSVIPPNVVVTPEDYAQNLARIQAARAYLATYEAQNEAGLQRFVSQEQELVQRIEAGREAESVIR